MKLRQALVLDELIRRDQDEWFWVKEPVPLFPGANGFYIKEDLAYKLKSLAGQDLFTGLEVREELYGRDVILGFGTTEAIIEKKSSWYALLQAETDRLLKQYLEGGSNEDEAKELVNWLTCLATTESREEQARLRYLIMK